MNSTALLLLPLSLALFAVGCQHKKTSGDKPFLFEERQGDAQAAEQSPDDEAADDKANESQPNPEDEAAEANETDGEPNGGGEDDVQIAEPEQPVDAECYKADDQVCKIELRILELVNKERAAPTKSGGLFGGGGGGPKAPLTNGKKLAFIARAWSVTQGQRGSIGHDGFPGARGQAFQTEFGTRAQMGAENVAMFGGGAGSVEEVAQQFYQMWYSSSGHYQNMMGNFQAVGIGVAQVNGSWWATQIFGRE